LARHHHLRHSIFAVCRLFLAPLSPIIINIIDAQISENDDLKTAIG
jgi:hypothetical protein